MREKGTAVKLNSQECVASFCGLTSRHLGVETEWLVGGGGHCAKTGSPIVLRTQVD
jgi:hypothetical protein